MMFWRIFRLELRVAFRHSAEIANPLWFFLIVITLFPLSIGPEPQLLARIAPGIIWVAALLSSLLALERLFRDDLQDGSLEQLMLLPLPLPAVVLAKVMAHWMVTGLPLLILSPLVAMLLGMDVYGWQVMALTLLLGTPTLGFLGAPGVALTVGLKRGGVLLSILVLPLTIPLLIFATAAMDAASMHLPVDGYLAILGALLAGTATLSPFATAAALRISIQERWITDFCSSLVSKLCGKHCINWRSHHGCIKSVAGLYRGWQLPVWSCLPSAGSGDSALLRLIISREIATALSTCMCLRRSGRWAFMHQWRWRRLLALSGR